ncbi:unnamed protein product [Rhodiola kirilowii]
MAEASSTSTSSEDENSLEAPFLRPRTEGTGRPTALGVLLGGATGRRGPSMLVRELEERRADWGYSKPVVALDMMWNAAFVVVSVVMLLCTNQEELVVPLRLWICGYALQCGIHVVMVWLEYKRRMSRVRVTDGERSEGERDLEEGGSESEEEEVGRTFGGINRSSITKRCESLNTMASFLWWIAGFYWVVCGGELLLQKAPHLYWLVVVFLAFDLFFAIFCIVLACLIGFALCCCLPGIIGILYAIAGQEGATEADLRFLPIYKFQLLSNEEKTDFEGAGKMILQATSSKYLALAHERILLPEDAECCICLTSYEDGAELHTLPCNHHFHSSCIVKWLKMNATCPLCKYNIVKGNEQV